MRKSKTKCLEEDEILVYYPDVVHYLSVFNIDRNMLEDAVQETFVQAFASLHTLKDRDKAKFWLIKIAKRVGIKYVAKANKTAKYERALEECVADLEYGSEFCDKDFDKLFSRLENEELYRYIRRLKPKEQKVLLLYYAYGHKLKDIAAAIGETESNTKSLSRRAKLKLKKMLEDGGFRNEKKDA